MVCTKQKRPPEQLGPTPQNYGDMVGPIATYVAVDPALDFIQRWQPDDRPEPSRLEFISNLSWLIWIVGISLIVAVGVVAYQFGRVSLLAYGALLFGLLMTV